MSGRQFTPEQIATNRRWVQSLRSAPDLSRELYVHGELACAVGHALLVAGRDMSNLQRDDPVDLRSDFERFTGFSWDETTQTNDAIGEEVLPTPAQIADWIVEQCPEAGEPEEGA